MGTMTEDSKGALRDIKITLSQGPVHAPTIEAEAEWMRGGPIWYPLATRPLHAQAGCWVYIIHGGALVARGRAEEFRAASDMPS
jgi:hypothetical protein